MTRAKLGAQVMSRTSAVQTIEPTVLTVARGIIRKGSDQTSAHRLASPGSNGNLRKTTTRRLESRTSTTVLHPASPLDTAELRSRASMFRQRSHRCLAGLSLWASIACLHATTSIQWPLAQIWHTATHQQCRTIPPNHRHCQTATDHRQASRPASLH